MDFVLEEGFTYIVDIDDNLSLPEKEQAKIYFKYATGSQALNCLIIEKDEDGNAVTKTDDRKQWEYICDKVENITIGGKPVDKMDIFDKGVFSKVYIGAITAYRLRTVLNKKK